jgi:hypothetical protein
MSKYFSDDSDLVSYVSSNGSIDTTDRQNVMPNLEQSQPHYNISDNQKEALNNLDVEKKLDDVSEDNQIIQKEFEKISKEKVKQTFKSFDALEVLERLNQITFLLIEQKHKIDKIEKVIEGMNVKPFNQSKKSSGSAKSEELTEREVEELKTKPDVIPKNIDELSPIERHKLETSNNSNVVDYLNPTTVQNKLNSIRSNAPSLPNEGFEDKSIVLEEIIPGKDPEAYQAAYSAMEEAKKRNPTVGYSKSPKGGLNGAGAGFN